MTRSIIPPNQTVSYGVYVRSVEDACRLPHEFLKEHAKRIEQAFDYGEPIAMIVEEMKLRYSLRPVKRHPTPLQCAVRVVRVK